MSTAPKNWALTTAAKLAIANLKSTDHWVSQDEVNAFIKAVYESLISYEVDVSLGLKDI